MAVFQNSESIDMNYNYYESSLFSMGWKKTNATESIVDSLDIPAIVMLKQDSQLYLCFYSNEDGNTCTVMVAGKEKS